MKIKKVNKHKLKKFVNTQNVHKLPLDIVKDLKYLNKMKQMVKC